MRAFVDPHGWDVIVADDAGLCDRSQAFFTASGQDAESRIALRGMSAAF